MRFIDTGPDIPPELIASQEKGEVLYVCGAGVSRAVGLPLFRGLVEGVYRHLGEDWNLHPAEREGMREGGHMEGQYDRVLRCLERRLVSSRGRHNKGMRERIRAAVRNVLKAPDGADLGNHLALMELSRDSEGRNRLITTNFDTLFERAWFERHHTAIATHAGPAMPQPKGAAFSGVLHLHGRLADPRPELQAVETDLVLTSAEFGDAYLRSGWASRYVYDLVRACPLVLVGYQADDPPMRYLLEALEADRERYPDLQKVYAFSSCEEGTEDLTRALWEAKGVEPILYRTAGGDHAPLYDALREWGRYADDPTAWPRSQLQGILAVTPSLAGDSRVQRAVELLGHGDQLLSDLSPAAEWLSAFNDKGIFSADRGLPGEWITKRMGDPGMIRVCAGLAYMDDRCRWQINQALEGEQDALSPVRAKAWRLLLTAKRSKNVHDLEDGWYLSSNQIRRGEIDFQALQLVSKILQPRLSIGKRVYWEAERGEMDAPEALQHLLDLQFQPAASPPASEILNVWPQNETHEIALFRVLDRALFEALEAAADVGALDGWDRTNWDVPSVAPHKQNAYHRGFYPITRVLADLWCRISGRNPNQARAFIEPWLSSRFPLALRLALFALEATVFSADEVISWMMTHFGQAALRSK